MFLVKIFEEYLIAGGVVSEPVIDKVLRGDVRGDGGQNLLQPVGEVRAGGEDVVEMRSGEGGVEFRWVDAEIRQQVCVPPSPAGTPNHDAIHIDHQCGELDTVNHQPAIPPGRVRDDRRTSVAGAAMS